MQIEVQDQQFTAYLDGQPVFSASDAGIARGTVGFRVVNACRIRNVKVTASNGRDLWDGLPVIPTASSFGAPLSKGTQ
jgi:hypothetical protein